MKLYDVTITCDDITVTSREGVKAEVDNEDVFSSFPKAKKQAIEHMKKRIADTKTEMATLRARKSLD